MSPASGSHYCACMEQICTDLAAEHDALDTIVAPLTEEQWLMPTPADGWNSKDTIIHLGQADYAAWLAVTDTDGFAELKAGMASGKVGLEKAAGDFSTTSGADLLGWWRDGRAKMLDAFRSRGPKDRIPWFGPDMSTLSFATARLMETWSHGFDVADTFGVAVEPTDRLRHVAHIGVTTRGWSYVNRGLDVPAGDVRVELTAPSGDVWTWGPEDADNTVKGDAEQFCLLVTQRRNRAGVALDATGPLAEGWLDIAQAFAGPATTPDGR